MVKAVDEAAAIDTALVTALKALWEDPAMKVRAFRLLVIPHKHTCPCCLVCGTMHSACL